jgi:dihydrolipoamide dehydrogenase
MYQQMQHADEYGLSVENVGFDLSKIVKRSRDVSAKLTAGIGHLLKKNKVQVFNGYAKLGKPGELQVDDDMTLSAKHIILATGARAAAPALSQTATEYGATKKR